MPKSGDQMKQVYYAYFIQPLKELTLLELEMALWSPTRLKAKHSDLFYEIKQVYTQLPRSKKPIKKKKAK